MPPFFKRFILSLADRIEPSRPSPLWIRRALVAEARVRVMLLQDAAHAARERKLETALMMACEECRKSRLEVTALMKEIRRLTS